MPSCYSKTNAHRRRERRQALRGTYRYVRWRWRLLFAVIDAVGRLLFWPARTLIGRRKNGPVDRRSMQRILLVQFDHLGDAVITLRTLHKLRRRFPQAAIDVLCSPWTAELFEASRDVRRVFVSHNNRFCRQRRWTWWLSTLRWGVRLRRHRYDTAFDVRGEAPLAALLWLTGARRRVGWNCGGGGFLLTHSPTYVQGRSEFESRNALWSTIELLDATPREETVPTNFASRLNVDEEMCRRIGARLSTLEQGDRPRIVLHLGAGTAAKRWPLEHWRRLIDRLKAEHHGTLIVIGTHDERHLTAAAMANRNARHVVDWTGELGVIEVACLLERADLFIGADSGPAHLAAAMRTPTVVLFSGTNNVRQWQPQGDHVHVVRNGVDCAPCHRSECAWSDHPCMRGITPHKVIEAAREVLDGFDVPSHSDLEPRRQSSGDVPSVSSEYISSEFVKFIGETGSRNDTFAKRSSR